MSKVRTKEQLDTHLLELQAGGHSMRFDELPRRVTYEIEKHYGTYSAVKRELSIKVRRKQYTTSNLRRKSKPSKWSLDAIEKELSVAVGECGTTASYTLCNRGYRPLVDAVKRNYGTWNAGLVALGYEVAYKYRSSDDNSTKDEVKEKVLRALATGVKPTRRDLEDNVQGLKTSIKIHFGSIDSLKEYCGFCAISDRPMTPKSSRKYCPRLTTADGIKREITRMWYIGVPLNYSFVKENRRYLLNVANEKIGSWKKAVESVGLNYADVTKQVTTNILSECGTEFEELFAELLTELGYEFIREGEGVGEVVGGFTLKPDFILPNWRWIDCKLSEWTDIRETIIRYHGESPNGITIVYLRGRNRRVERGRKWEYEHVSVYQFTKLLPEERRKHYESKLREIERKADEEAVA